MGALADFRDRFLGRGEASVTVPPLDGALKPNNLLEDAAAGLFVVEPDNLVVFGDGAIFSSGNRLMRGEAVLASLPSAITALAASPSSATLVVACGDGSLHLYDRDLKARTAALKPLACVTALRFVDETTLLACVGSATHGPGDWKRDLLTRGRSGSLWRIAVDSGDATRIAGDLAFPYAVAAHPDGGFVVAESWAKRLVHLDARGKIAGQVLEDLPGFPARLSPSSRGGHWLCVFAPRSQLIEFVLREPAYRNAMMAEVDPDLWVAPALRSNISFFEPMQGGALKQMGILKPWAPTRSYGLVVELDGRFQPLRSFHSRADGRRHGITSALELDGRLWLTSKGGDEVLSLDLHAGRPEAMAPIIELKGVGKEFFGVAALDNVNFTLERGEVHSLLGENGAGKSTLTKIIAGVYKATTGEVLFEGKEFFFANPAEALKNGIAMVFQETSLVPSLTVAQNLYLGNEKFLNRLRGIYISAQQFLQSLNFGVDPTVYVSQLGAAQKQMVEIARAVHHKAKVIIFDEPTATLTPEEKHHFFSLIRRLKRDGVSIIFISHALEEALEVSDRITILRDGKHIATDKASAFDRAKIIAAMVGRSLSGELYGRAGEVRKARGYGAKVLSVQNLSMGNMVRNTSFSVYAGQVTGVFGLIGSGRTETAKIIAGVVKRDFFHGGEVRLDGRSVRYRVPRPAVKDGIVYVTEDRKLEGFFETKSIAENIYLNYLATDMRKSVVVSTSEMIRLSKSWTERLNVRGIGGSGARVIELSGGNQQKVVIARALVQKPKLIIFDEPTRGVDVGAIAELHQTINELADSGLAVMVISSYLPEILNLADRILVSRQGRIVEEFAVEDATEEKIMYAAVH